MFPAKDRENGIPRQKKKNHTMQIKLIWIPARRVKMKVISQPLNLIYSLKKK